jgi:transcriptional regulator with XRE-family HTH domain
MAKGFSLTAFAGEIGVARETIYAWENNHTEFGDAVKRARAVRVLYWEKRLIKAERAEATPIIFALKNACADEWRQTPDVSVSVNDLGNIPIEQASAEDARRYLIATGALDANGRLIQRK